MRSKRTLGNGLHQTRAHVRPEDATWLSGFRTWYKRGLVDQIQNSPFASAQILLATLHEHLMMSSSTGTRVAIVTGASVRPFSETVRLSKTHDMAVRHRRSPDP